MKLKFSNFPHFDTNWYFPVFWDLECPFLAKNSRRLKIHYNAHKRGSQNLDSIRIHTTTDVINSILNDNDKNSGLTNSCSLNKELVPCLICNDGKFYKNKSALRIPCTRHHKSNNYQFMFD